MTREPVDDPWAHIDRLLDQQMLKHFEMAELIGGYRDMLADLEEQRKPAEDMVRLARSLPGAKYHVATTYVNENWKVISGELKRLFPEVE